MSVATLAEEIAREAHKGQLDKQGQPYIDHVARVAGAVEGEHVKAVAWLHDVVEDGHFDYDDLFKFGLPFSVTMRVFTLTRRKGEESYDEYIRRVSLASASTIRVKLADLRDNLRPCPNAERLYARYHKAIAVLEAVLASVKDRMEARG
jgi:(p)ppGpp synthase/HD superfamily hydrolase